MKIVKNNKAAINMIIMGLLILIISALSIAIFYPIFSAVDTESLNTRMGEFLGDTDNNDTRNVTNNIVSTSNTVMGLNPLAALVAVAAGIIALLLGAFLVGSGGLPKL